jgi:hypothetical protein
MNGKIRNILTITIVLLIIAVLMGWVLSIAFADIEDVSVSVEYNIAAVIGALLGGSGVAIFGVTYAQSKFAEWPKGKDKE